MKTFSLILFSLLSLPSFAMQSRVLSVQQKAYMTPSSEGLHQILDLKKRQVIFQSSDFDQCGKVMLRTKNTLQFECKLKLPTYSTYNRLRTQISALTLSVRLGGSEKAVAVQINPAASEVTFSTKFDPAGIDFELASFNDDLLRVYSKVAQLVFAQAMQQNPLVYEVYENPSFNTAEQIEIQPRNDFSTSTTKQVRSKKKSKRFIPL